MEGLYEASLRGDVEILKKLLKKNPLIPLDEKFTSHSRTPLHIAAMCGHVKFAGELLRKKRELTMEKDSHGFTPLHLASARPSISMVKQLLDFGKEACTVQDEEGRTPLHVAAMKNRVKIMKELIKHKPEAIHHIQNGTNETILHICVKYKSLDALKLLVEELPSVKPPSLDMDVVSVNSKNIDGDTILHLAAQMSRRKCIKYLVESKNIGIDINAVNNKGVKALHMLPETERENLEIGYYDPKKQKKRSPEWVKERVNALMVVATLIAGIAFQAAMNPPGGVFQDDSIIQSSKEPVTFTYYLRAITNSSKSGYFSSYLATNFLSWIPIMKNAKVAKQNTTQSLNMTKIVHATKKAKIVTTTYLLYELLNTTNNDSYTTHGYVMSKSPGIVLEHEKWNKIISKYKPRFSPYLIRYAGTPILAYKNPTKYRIYMTCNAIAFIISLSIIMLVISGFIYEKSRNQQVRVLVVLMFVSIMVLFISYIVVFISMSPPFYANKCELAAALYVSVPVMCFSMYGSQIYSWLRIKFWKIKNANKGELAMALLVSVPVMCYNMYGSHIYNLLPIKFWKIKKKEILVDQLQVEDIEKFGERGHGKKAFLKFTPVYGFLILVMVSHPLFYRNWSS